MEKPLLKPYKMKKGAIKQVFTRKAYVPIYGPSCFQIQGGIYYGRKK